MDRGPGGIPWETQVPQAIDKVVLETAHFWNMASDERAQGVWGLKATPTITAGVSVQTE